MVVRRKSNLFTSMANFSVPNIVDLDQTALRRAVYPDTLFVQRLDWNLAEHKAFRWRAMMAQHCWLSSFLIFQGILISIYFL